MKNKIKSAALLFLVIFTLIFAASCIGTGSDELSVERVYAMARSSGYSGTLEEFIEAFKGEAGLGISSCSVNDSNHLIITLSDGTAVDCGEIKVQNGKDGNDGNSLSIGTNGNWYINGEDTGVCAYGQNGENGKDGKDGSDGADWQCGEGLPKATLGKNGDLYLDTAAYDVYRKENGEWKLVGNFFSGTDPDFTVNAGDNYNINITGSGNSNALAASKGMFSSVLINAYPNEESAHGSAGSGVIFKLDKNSGDAYIITNYHVVYSTDISGICENIFAFLFGLETTDKAMPCEFIGGSLNYDIAVIKITDSQVLRESNAIEAEIADSDSVAVLDTVIAIGNAEGEGMSATVGAISVAIEQLSLTGSDGITPVKMDVFRYDAAVNHGNSGGGLFNSEGKLVGIVNAKREQISVENMGYAIPSNTAAALAENIIAFCDGTDTVNPLKITLGISVTAVPDGASFDSVTGAVKRAELITVTSVDPASVSDGKLAAGDIIKSISVNEKTYQIDRLYQLNPAIFTARVGYTLTVNFLRGGEGMSASFVIEEGALKPVL